MIKSKYKILNKFECYGETMVVILIDRKAACLMTERDYNKIIETERKYRKPINLKLSKS